MGSGIIWLLLLVSFTFRPLHSRTLSHKTLTLIDLTIFPLTPVGPQ